MAMDPDVKFAVEQWDAGAWSAYDVCDCIARQWRDRHVDDADGDKSNVNAHAPEDVLVFLKASAAVAAETIEWAAMLATLVLK